MKKLAQVRMKHKIATSASATKLATQKWTGEAFKAPLPMGISCPSRSLLPLPSASGEVEEKGDSQDLLGEGFSFLTGLSWLHLFPLPPSINPALENGGDSSTQWGGGFVLPMELSCPCWSPPPLLSTSQVAEGRKWQPCPSLWNQLSPQSSLPFHASWR